jgi:hypothetical protein
MTCVAVPCVCTSVHVIHELARVTLTEGQGHREVATYVSSVEQLIKLDRFLISVLTREYY